MASIACSAGELLAQREPTPLPTRPAAPTFTPTSDVAALVVITPPAGNTPGVIIVPPGVDPRSLIPIPPTDTPTPTATYTPVPPSEATAIAETATAMPPTPTPVTPLPTPTPIPTDTPTATPTTTPTPFVAVQSGLVNLRTGPGPDYPLVAQLGPGIPVAVVGQNPEGDWLQICCVNGDSVWVARSHVQVANDTSEVFLVVADLPPTVTPTGTPTPTPTITLTPTPTPYPFQVAIGPQYFITNNELFTIWAKIFRRDPGGDVPLPGYSLAVKFRNRADNSAFETRPNTKGEQPSTDFFEFNVPPGTASGNRVEYNYKFEYLPPNPKDSDPNTTATRLSLMDGYWQVYVVDPSGQQVSDAIEFNTLSGNNNREIYIAWAPTQ